MFDPPPRQQNDLLASPAAPLFSLPWPDALVEGALVRRYDRFLVDVALADGAVVTAHCANPGSMEGLVSAGARVWLSPARDPARRLRWTWSFTEVDGVPVGVDTSLPNRLVRAMLEARVMVGLRGWRTLSPEYAHAPGSRVDFRLTGRGGAHDVEVKNCHLVYPDGRGYFPDSVSERATKHLRLLEREARRGVRATVLFVVQRPDARSLRPSDVHDPEFARAARDAGRAGVRFRALRARPDLDGLHVLGSIPVDLAPYDTARPARWREALRPRSGWQRGARKP